MQIIYYESAIKNHPRVRQIIARMGAKAILIECEHYQEIFNLKAQNFRLQKRRPALILAKKTGHFVLPTPSGFGIGGQYNYYFSHMLNCLYDCRYCFLQGMYRSAHYVIFVNYEDFAESIIRTSAANKETANYFFSGYDCDSLAFDKVTGFLDFFLPIFAKHPQAILELRTKSATVQPLLQTKPLANCIVAFSLTPVAISQQIEHKVPPLEKRLQAIEMLAKAGWRIGLRFDPLIIDDNGIKLYQELFTNIFSRIPYEAIHSVSLGLLRFPEKMQQKIAKLYPQEKLLACSAKQDNLEMLQEIHSILEKYVSKDILFVAGRPDSPTCGSDS